MPGKRFRERVTARVCAQPRAGVCDVVAYRALGQVETLGDLLVRQALPETFEYFALYACK